MDFHFNKRRRCLEVLGLSLSASNDDIKKAFRSMALRLHPDKNPRADANRKFQEIQEAYTYLSEGVRSRQDGAAANADVNFFEEILHHLFPWFATSGQRFRGAGYQFPSFHDIFNFNDGGNSDLEDGIYFYADSRPPMSNFSSYSSEYQGQRSNVNDHEQAKQTGKSSKKSRKEERNARKENNYSSRFSSQFDQNQWRANSTFERNPRSANNAFQGNPRNAFEQCQQRDTSSFGQGQRRASSPPANNQRYAYGSFVPREKRATSAEQSKSRTASPCENQSRNDSKEASPPSDESTKQTKKSKRQLKAEQKQKEQEMSAIRQRLEEEEEKKKRKSDERRLAQEQRENAEREVQEMERKKEDERLRIEKEAADKKREEERKQKAKEAAERKNRQELLKDFDANDFLGDDGEFHSNNLDLLDIIKVEMQPPKEDDEKVDSINGIPLADLARLQKMNLNDTEQRKKNRAAQRRDPNPEQRREPDTAQGREPNVCSDKPGSNRHRRNSRKGSKAKSNYDDSMGDKQYQMPNGHATQMLNPNQEQFKQQQHQQQRVHQYQHHGHQMRQSPRPFLSQHHVCLSQGPTLAPTLPPPQLDRPPPPLRFVLRPCFPRQSGLYQPAAYHFVNNQNSIAS